MDNGCWAWFNPSVSRFRSLPDANFEARAVAPRSCCCRVNHRLITYSTDSDDWVADDLYYGGIERRCAGGTGAVHNRVYSR